MELSGGGMRHGCWLASEVSRRDRGSAAARHPLSRPHPPPPPPTHTYTYTQVLLLVLVLQFGCWCLTAAAARCRCCSCPFNTVSCGGAERLFSIPYTQHGCAEHPRPREEGKSPCPCPPAASAVICLLMFR